MEASMEDSILGLKWKLSTRERISSLSSYAQRVEDGRNDQTHACREPTKGDDITFDTGVEAVLKRMPEDPFLQSNGEHCCEALTWNDIQLFQRIICSLKEISPDFSTLCYPKHTDCCRLSERFQKDYEHFDEHKETKRWDVDQKIQKEAHKLVDEHQTKKEAQKLHDECQKKQEEHISEEERAQNLHDEHQKKDVPKLEKWLQSQESMEFVCIQALDNIDNNAPLVFGDEIDNALALNTVDKEELKTCIKFAYLQALKNIKSNVPVNFVKELGRALYLNRIDNLAKLRSGVTV